MSLAKQALIFLAAHVAAALFFLLDRTPGTAAALHGFPLDDAWIHMVYARSLAALQGFAYNPGQPETGATSPLWTLLLVPASWVARGFGVSVVLPAKVTGMLVGVGASLAAARVARGLGLGLAVELSAGLAIAADPMLAFAQVSGMEVLLASALALWVLATLAAERPRVAAIAAGLAPLARPELILLSVPALALVLWRSHRRGAGVRALLVRLLPSLVCVGGWMVYCLAVSGYPLPSTFYAKFTSRPEFFSHNLAMMLGQVLPGWPWFAHGAGFVLWLIGARTIVRHGAVGWLVALFPVAYLLAVAGSQHFPQAWPFYWQRYFLPALPAILLCIAAGSVQVVAWAWERRHKPWALASAGVAVALVAGALVGLPSALGKAAGLHAWNCQNIEELNVAIARWLREHAPPGQTIAVSDAGAARYFADRPIFDMVGLNNHRFLHRARSSGGGLDPMERIDMVTTFPGLVPFVQASREWQPVHRVSTAHLTICDCPQSELVAYRRVAPPP